MFQYRICTLDRTLINGTAQIESGYDPRLKMMISINQHDHLPKVHRSLSTALSDHVRKTNRHSNKPHSALPGLNLWWICYF